MTVGIDDGKFYLLDNFPGLPTNGPNPDDWTSYTAAKAFRVGEKRAIYDDTNNGWAILVYLQYQKGTAAAATVKSVCGLCTASVATAGAWANVTNTTDECMNTGPICVALGTCTDAYYGWFWCGGVCPVDTISGLDGVYPSDGSVAAVSGMKIVAASSLNTFELWTGSEIGILSAISLAADANAA
jgi:hypothetical protein